MSAHSANQQGYTYKFALLYRVILKSTMLAMTFIQECYIYPTYVTLTNNKNSCML